MFLRNNVYRNRTVALANNAKLRENVVIHEGCRVGRKTEILNSVVGRNCVFGQNCVLENAFIFDDVKIGDKCVLKNCVIGRKSVLLNEIALHDGTIVGDYCKIPDRTQLDKAFVVARQAADELDDGEQRFSLFFLHHKQIFEFFSLFICSYLPETRCTCIHYETK